MMKTAANELQDRKELLLPKKLIFNTETGELLFSDTNVNKENIVIDQIYETGFFR